MAPFKFRAGRTPLLVSMPHTGTHVPAEIKKRLTGAALPQAPLDVTKFLSMGAV